MRVAYLGIAAAVAWFSPVAWYWKIGIFAAIWFGIGLVVQAFASRRERRYQRERNSN
jgi:membrane protein implicated in regulation of membrane protease activity